MKITPKILHLPPYLSASWTQISALYVKEGTLVVNLKDGTQVHIPKLPNEMMDAIFAAHAAFLESQQRPERASPIHIFQTSASDAEGQSLKLNFDSLDSFQSAMQHNPAQAGMPDLPKEILSKIAAIARAVAPDDIANIPKPEPHCNCVHCQIAKAILGEFDAEEKPKDNPEEKEEAISDADLEFQQWEITQTGDKLYTVINKLDTQEKYSVYLGHPVGCTCGKQGCEHVLAVLKS